MLWNLLLYFPLSSYNSVLTVDIMYYMFYLAIWLFYCVISIIICIFCTGEPQPLLRHHSGHFRHKMAVIWDPHPQYEFTAFGRVFHLMLAHDSSFVLPDIKVSNTLLLLSHKLYSIKYEMEYEEGNSSVSKQLFFVNYRKSL